MKLWHYLHLENQGGLFENIKISFKSHIKKRDRKGGFQTQLDFNHNSLIYTDDNFACFETCDMLNWEWYHFVDDKK